MWCRDLCHGSGKKTHSSVTEPAGSMVASTSGAFASTTRTLLSPRLLILISGVGQAGGVDLHGQEVLVRVLLGGVADGVAQAGTDLHDQRGRAAEFGLGVEHVVRVHGGVGDVAGDLDGPAVGVLLPGGLAAALQAGAAAHEADRPAAVGAERGLAAGGHRAGRAGGVWGDSGDSLIPSRIVEFRRPPGGVLRLRSGRLAGPRGGLPEWGP